ncbi:MAG: hypothetical protein M1813_008176 [Trichoglossum hirsutum]|jgi:gamma-glutamylcyclotransferase|nr:MAG: hypothetical protein M1813_008176 [Trichoglossum hirsutum]
MASASTAIPLDANEVPTIPEQQSSPLYFGFGSNMWLDQMKRRCPGSPYVGIAILEGWKWIINRRGYANVVRSDGDIVYGLVYELSGVDEGVLDRCEGVPYMYTKEIHQIELFRKGMGLPGEGSKGEAVSGLVYVDVKRVLEGDPQEEYIGRMNMAIEDVLKVGVPQWYIDKYIRKSIPKSYPSSSHPRDGFLDGLNKK